MHRRARALLLLLLVLTAAGALYGWIGALRNQNPHYEPGAAPASFGAAWGWKPSPVWLPSYLLCTVPRNGYGISRTRSGYLFRSDAARRQYRIGSAVAGSAMGLTAGALLLVASRAVAAARAKGVARPVPNEASARHAR